MTSIHKARKMERHLNTHAKEGWGRRSQDMLILGFDVGLLDPQARNPASLVSCN